MRLLRNIYSIAVTSITVYPVPFAYKLCFLLVCYGLHIMSSKQCLYLMDLDPLVYSSLILCNFYVNLLQCLAYSYVRNVES